MLKEKYEVKERIVTENVCVGRHRICDICGKEIERDDGYWNCHTFHNDWGNDSVESHEYFDICSVECLKVKFDEYCDDSSTEYNTKEIKIEHCNGW